MRIIAHRGMHHPEPTGPADDVRPGPSENTLGALEAAVAEPCVDGLECDIRLLGDGTAVVFHDADTLRLTGRHLRLVDLDVAAWRSLRALCGAPLPTLAEALPVFEAALQRADFEVHIEIKPHPRVEPALTALRAALAGLSGLSGRATPGCLVVSSFDPRFLAGLDGMRPAVGMALIAHVPPGLDALRFLPGRPVDVHVDVALLEGLATESDGVAGWMRQWHQQGRAVRVWTVDDAARARRLQGLPEDARPAGLITNRPDVIARALRGPDL